MSAAACLAISIGMVGYPMSATAEAVSAQSQVVSNAPTSFADVVERVKPAVVAIKVKGVDPDENHRDSMEISPEDRANTPQCRKDLVLLSVLTGMS